jgi:hypothetical protein
MRPDELETRFPRLVGSGYRITSPETPDYNCIAWAAADEHHWWQPDPFHQYFWPDGVARSYELAAYLEVFARLGYVQCESAELEAGFEKVAIYRGFDGFPSHMARQLPDGSWTSKLGSSFDIVHPQTVHVEGNDYGHVWCVLRRRG